MSCVTRSAEVDSLMLAASERPDDLDRLHVLADALEDVGDLPRAEFVRIQALQAEWPTLADSDRVDELLSQHGRAWTAGYPALDGVSYWFVGGLPAAEVTDFAQATRHAKALVNAGVRALLVKGPAGVERINRCRALARLTALYLDNRRSTLTPEDFRRVVGRLAGCPHLAGLRVLGLRWGSLPPGAVEALAGSPHLAGLRSLDLENARIDAADIKVLCDSEHLSQVKDLNLYGNVLGTSVTYLPWGRGLSASLETLDLGNNHITLPILSQLFAGLRHARSPLRRLNLTFNSLGGSFLPLTLGNIECPPEGLKGIDLSSNGFLGDELKEVREIPWMNSLDALLLHANATDYFVRLRLEKHFQGRVKLFTS